MKDGKGCRRMIANLIAPTTGEEERGRMNRHLALILLMVCGQAAAASGVAASFGKTDPWVWVLGGLGAAVVYVKNPPATKSNALINSMISVMIGGLVAPPCAAYCSQHYDQTLASPYPFAFVLSAFWPWLVPALIRRIQALIGGDKSPKDTQPERDFVSGFERRTREKEVKVERRRVRAGSVYGTIDDRKDGQ
jgi:hypothetical protein